MRILIVLWVLVVTFLSMMPMSYKDALGTTGQFHYAGHFFIFVITAVVFCWTAKGTQNRILRAGGAVAVGIAMEILERLGYHHRLEKRDILVDTLGVLTGLVATMLFAPGNSHAGVLVKAASSKES
jgi:hypothetical protein